MQAIYALKETCQILKVSRRTVLRWIESGRLKGFKLAGARLWRIRERDLKEFTKGGSESRA